MGARSETREGDGLDSLLRAETHRFRVTLLQFGRVLLRGMNTRVGYTTE